MPRAADYPGRSGGVEVEEAELLGRDVVGKRMMIFLFPLFLSRYSPRRCGGFRTEVFQAGHAAISV